MASASLIPYLQLYWHLKPNHLRIGILHAQGLKGKRVFVEFSTPSRSSYSFPTYITKTLYADPLDEADPYWGETFLLRNMARQKRDVPIHIIIYSSVGHGTNEFIGEFRINAKKYYQESVSNGQRVRHKEFIIKPANKKAKTLPPVSLHLRFVAQ
eukprot:TRINITY_DN30004_c0_g1_i1.p1 TRINITY_DN30004_c0_g1~~TRINITY_DN30004_c0_g1_i1.p1  ORF type:complete len:155 (-),score=34.00 TRINITY_DN30004_c0_g1_i1:162-626(-)